MSELSFVLIVYQICFRTVAPLCHSLRTLLFAQFPVSTAHGPDCTPGPRICLFAKFRRITSEVSATVLRFRPRESLRPQLRRRGSARNARYIYVHVIHICAASAHTSRRSLSLRWLPGPTRCIAFLSDCRRADTGARIVSVLYFIGILKFKEPRRSSRNSTRTDSTRTLKF